MRFAKVAIAVLLGAAALLLLGRFFVSQLESSPRAAGPQAVLFSAPPGYSIIEAGELARVDAARRLQAVLAASPADALLGLRFADRGDEIYWLVDPRDAAGPRLIERIAGANGTRLENVYRGEVERRLRWAAASGDLGAPGAAPVESRNLYH